MSPFTRLLDAVLPVPDPDRLVAVAEVGRSTVPFVEGCLADVGVSPVIQEIRTMTGTSWFKVLVPRRDAEVAAQACAGF